jgi:hypothetical protein
MLNNYCQGRNFNFFFFFLKVRPNSPSPTALAFGDHPVVQPKQLSFKITQVNNNFFSFWEGGSSTGVQDKASRNN